MKKIMCASLMLLLIFGITGVGLAGLEVGGTLKAELSSDILNLSSNEPQFDPSEEGLILPGLYPLQVFSLGLDLKFSYDQIDAFVPLTIVSPLGPLLLLSDDYLNIPFYFSFESAPYIYRASSRPVGDAEFGFVDLNDPLGIARSPNSHQPIMTLKLDVDYSEKLDAVAYVLFDQKVKGLPRWEQIPTGVDTVGNQVLNFGTDAKPNNKLVSECGFTDETAQYNFLRVDGKIKDEFKVGLIYGQKYVDNPAFRLQGVEEEGSAAVILQGWGYVRDNIVVDMGAMASDNLEIKGALLKSSVAWREYGPSQIKEKEPDFNRWWHPYEVKGRLSGDASYWSANYKQDTGFIRVSNWYVEQGFQAVAATHSQFPVITRLVPRSIDDPTCDRYAHAIFDPSGDLSGERLVGSPVVEYLGKRVVKIETVQDGRIGVWPMSLYLSGSVISGLDTAADSYQDELTGAAVTKDYKELSASIYSQNPDRYWKLTGANRKYLADTDYKRWLAVTQHYHLASFNAANTIEKVWRLRDDDNFGEGSALRANTVLERKIGKADLCFNADWRAGNYDYDLLEFNSDRVVDPYSNLRLNAYLSWKQEFSSAGKRGQALVAGEILNQKSNLSGVLSGTSLIGYLGLDVPLTERVRGNVQYVVVQGPAENSDDFPSECLRPTFHQELSYKPVEDKNMEFKFGYTLRPAKGEEISRKDNLYTEFAMVVGPGNLSIRYGQGTLPAFAYQGANLPGSLNLDGAYGIGYAANKLLRERPWSEWEDKNLYALWNKRLRSTEETWDTYLALTYWFSF
jgi:hypothetical protein